MCWIFSLFQLALGVSRLTESSFETYCEYSGGNTPPDLDLIEPDHWLEYRMEIIARLTLPCFRNASSDLSLAPGCRELFLGSGTPS